MILEFLSATNIAIILLALISSAYLFLRSGHKNLPPGPWGLPIFGSSLSLAYSKNASKLLREMAKVYGNVMTVKLGSKSAIVLTGYDAIKEALVDNADIFSVRPFLHLWEAFGRRNGLLFTSQYKERRRIALTSMRDFGLGKKSLDDRMQVEARMLLQELEKSEGKALDLSVIIPIATTNIICSIIRGDRFSYDSEIMQDIVNALINIIDFAELANIDNYVPLTRYKPFNAIKPFSPERDQSITKIYAMINSWIKEHKETFDSNNIRDLIDLMISQASGPDHPIKEENIPQISFDLFVAGTETTSTTLLWAIAYLIVHKDIQQRCRREIHEVVGRGKIPDYASLKNMPYFNAVINEIQRKSSIVPLSFLHSTSEDVSLQGYSIPKDSIILTNLDTALKDEKYFGDPNTFRPERWLDAEGKLMKFPAHIPFSAGKRECLGKLLATKEIFVFLSSMLQNFEFEMEDSTKPPDMNKGHGLVNAAPPYSVKAKKI